MTWVQAEFQIEADKVDALTSVLEAFFAQAITTENAGDDEFYEVAFPSTPDWEIVRLTALFNEQVDVEPIVDFVQQNFGQRQEIPVQVRKLEDHICI